MQEFITRPSLYNFLRYANNHPLEKNILDCGAGGDTPPLYLFHLHGYATFGIDISDNQLELAHKFGQKMKVDLNIQKGDMRDLQFEDASFSFIYSIDTITHLSKLDAEKAINEMKRVIQKEGLVYLNFNSKLMLPEDKLLEEKGFLKEKGLNDGEFKIHGDLHTFYDINEPDRFFDANSIIYKETKYISRIFSENKIQYSCIDYIIKF